MPRWKTWPAPPGICWSDWSTRTGGPLWPSGPPGQEPHPAQDPDPRRRRRRLPTAGTPPPERPAGRGPAADRRAELLPRRGGPPMLAHRRRRRAAALFLGGRLALRHQGTLCPSRAHHPLEGIRRTCHRDVRFRKRQRDHGRGHHLGRRQRRPDPARYPHPPGPPQAAALRAPGRRRLHLPGPPGTSRARTPGHRQRAAAGQPYSPAPPKRGLRPGRLPHRLRPPTGHLPPGTRSARAGTAPTRHPRPPPPH